METVSFESLEKIKDTIGNTKELKREISDPIQRLDVSAYLSHYGVDIARTKHESDKTIYCLTKCLFDPNHGKGESSVIQGRDGKLAFQCFHNSCQGRKWKDARNIISGNDSLKEFISGHVRHAKSIPLEGKDILSYLESWDSIRAMEIKIEWIIDRLIPAESITLLFGKGGIGKTWLTLDMARCIAGGIPYLGLSTIKTPVFFIDFENPLPVLNTRTKKLGDGEGVYFWRANNDRMKAPKLDKKDYELYKQLPKGTVLIFDTLRASQDRDENKSDEMGLIMGRLKELRDMGFTIILLHHTAKNSDRVAKGSTAIVDLADHILGLTLVRKKRDGQEIVVDEDDPDDDLVYRFGVREKTRFEPYHIYLTLNPDRGFDLAPDPQEDTMKAMFEVLNGQGTLKKTVFLKDCKEKTGLGEKKLRRLFDIGQGRYWSVEKPGTDNAQIVRPIRFGGFSSLYSIAKPQNQNPVMQGEEKIDPHEADESLDNKGFSGFAKDFCQTSKPEIIDVLEVIQ